MRFVMLVVIVLALACGQVIADPIVIGGVVYNELVNGDFSINPIGNGWTVVQGALQWFPGELDGQTGYISCGVSNPGWFTIVRQVTDEAKFPGWNWAYDQKVIDLQAKIKLEPGAGVRFYFDYWKDYIGDDEPTVNTPGYGYIYSSSQWEWVNNGTTTTDWMTVNPFNQQLLKFQPRWISLEIQFLQPNNSYAYVDDVIVTGQCVPEPITIVLGAIGLSAVGGLRRLRRK